LLSESNPTVTIIGFTQTSIGPAGNFQTISNAAKWVMGVDGCHVVGEVRAAQCSRDVFGAFLAELKGSLTSISVPSVNFWGRTFF
jgi:hypothetical protein